MKFLSLFFAILWICFNSSVLHADSMYSWTDENGVMNLSNRPPPGNASDIKVYKMLEGGGDEKGELTDRAKTIIDHTPLGRFGDPEDLIGTLFWLLDSKASRFVTGIVVPVDGGFSAFSGV